jgi:hypothetical protein
VEKGFGRRFLTRPDSSPYLGERDGAAVCRYASMLDGAQAIADLSPAA